MAIALVYHKDPESDCFNDLRRAVFGMTHAGQESHWFAVSDGKRLHTLHGSGTVDIMEPVEVYDGSVGVGRNSSRPGTMPAVSYSSGLGEFAVAFDGYLMNGDGLREKYGGESDAELSARFIADANDFRRGMENLRNAAKGHFCITASTEKGRAYVARHPLGVRPLIYGEGERGHAVVTESRALGNMNMEIVRDIMAGEIAEIDGSGIHTLNPEYEMGSEMRVCSFLWPYYQMIDCVTQGMPVTKVKMRIGAAMGKADKKDEVGIDFVAYVPDSGRVYEEGYALAYGCPHGELITKYQYAGRSYERPGQFLRDLIAGVKISSIPGKVAMIEEIVEELGTGLGQRDGIREVAFTEDSIRRGTQLIRDMGPIHRLRQSGAENLHGRICSPRNIAYCRCSPPDDGVYRDDELAANRFRTDEEMATFLGIKSVRFIGVGDFVDCITRGSKLAKERLCLGCYTNDFAFLD